MYLAASASGGSGIATLLPLALIIVAMWFFMIRPQQKRRREAMELQNQLGVGDEIVTIGGLYGRVVGVDDEAVTLEVSPGVTNRYARAAVGRVVSKQTGSAEKIVDED